ncbi:hypothetical protein K435DRAFT_789653 [Dendrothele bispora CBS 962.96]|uniref:Glycosyl hydrolase family 95 N-terminal domain-containing protein n=1 Tax=Dendrothele bispora (strain CBS 962.96) TaxID=1314807 RepID=A0A4S8MSU4_DENBC|nr:hypothetical protein K435DRAFT_789653 [Dendrothele bispora CBS 962.96]
MLLFELAIAIAFAVKSVVAANTAATTMWFDTSNIVPIGNGRLGAQILGQFPKETIVLNEDRIWSGSINDPNNKNCPGVLPQIRDFICLRSFVQGRRFIQRTKYTAGNLTLTFPNAQVSNLNHSLDLNTALATTTYEANGVQFTRSAFASHPDNVIVMRFTASSGGMIQFNAGFVTPMASPVGVTRDGGILSST